MRPKYNFTLLKSRNFNILSNKEALDYLMKWSIKGQLNLVTFCFNEPFQSYQKNDLVEDFFKDAAVAGVLGQMLPHWQYTADSIEKIKTDVMQSTVSSLSFFDRLLNGTNNVVTVDGSIRQCCCELFDGFTVADELRKMLLDSESDNYGLFNESDRRELIFLVFQFLVLGGQWCQYEDKIVPYLDLTKMLYKDLLRLPYLPMSSEASSKVSLHVAKEVTADDFPAVFEQLLNLIFLKEYELNMTEEYFHSLPAAFVFNLKKRVY